MRSLWTLLNSKAGTRRPRGAAAVELAVTLPLLVLITAIALDYSRISHANSIVANAARNAALLASDPTDASNSPYLAVPGGGLDSNTGLPNLASVRAAVLADFPSQFQPNIAISYLPGTSNRYVEVTVSYRFDMLTGLLGFTSQTITRTVRMNIQPASPS